jgi:hypothetical protein
MGYNLQGNSVHIWTTLQLSSGLHCEMLMALQRSPSGITLDMEVKSVTPHNKLMTGEICQNFSCS